MYKYKDFVYADAGCYLKDNNVIAFRFDSPSESCKDVEFDLSTVKPYMNVIKINNIIVSKLPKDKSYSNIVTTIVNTRYSNDDQIAIICNNREDEVKHMNEFREFAKSVAKRVIELLNK